MLIIKNRRDRVVAIRIVCSGLGSKWNINLIPFFSTKVKVVRTVGTLSKNMSLLVFKDIKCAVKCSGSDPTLITSKNTSNGSKVSQKNFTLFGRF